MATIGKPLDERQIQPTKDRILAVRYERPAMSPGGLHIPAPFRIDPNWAYWEVVAWRVCDDRCRRKKQAHDPCASCRLGCKLSKGDILRTKFRPAIDLAAEDSEGRRLFIVAAENVTGVIPNTWS